MEFIVPVLMDFDDFVRHLTKKYITKTGWHLYNTCITKNKKTSTVKILVYTLLLLDYMDFSILEYFQNHSKKLILNHARLPVPPHPQYVNQLSRLQR